MGNFLSEKNDQIKFEICLEELLMRKPKKKKKEGIKGKLAVFKKARTIG